MPDTFGKELKTMLYWLAKGEGLGEESAVHFARAVLLFIGWLLAQP